MNQEVLKVKQSKVSEITESIKKSKSLVIIEYRGLTVAELTELRRALRADNATMGIYKNSLFQRAIDELGHSDVNPLLFGPNAYVFSEDTIVGPKAVRKFARKNEKLIIKGGLIEGKFADAEQIKVVAALPGREGLISMFLSVLNAPIRNFACAVKAVAEKAN